MIHPMKQMPSTGTDAEKPQDNLSERSLQQPAVISGQIDSVGGMRAVFEELNEQCRHVQHGILRILSKDVRGYVGVFCGSYITGAHITSTREYGITALKELVVANRGMYAFVSVREQQVELKQSLGISIEDLLTWRPHARDGRLNPSLQDAIDVLATNSGRMETITEEQLKEIQADLLGQSKVVEEDKGAFMAWGGDMPVLASNLARLTPRLMTRTGELRPEQIERIPIPEDLDELVRKQTGQMEKPQGMSAVPGNNEAVAPPQAPVSLPPELQSNGFRVQQPIDPNGGSANEQPPAVEGKGPVWSAADLDAIPTPTGKTAPTDDGEIQQSGQYGSEHDALQRYQQAEVQRERARRNARLGNFNRSLDPSLQMGMNANISVQGEASGLTNPAARPEDNLGFSPLASQRMQAVDAAALLSQSTVHQPVFEPRQGHGMLIGGTVAAILAAFLTFQVASVLMNNNQFQSGMDALKQGDNAQAVNAFTAVINSQPNMAQGYIYRAIAEARSDQTQNALQDFSQAIVLDPHNPSAYASRATLRLQSNDYDGAISDCDTIQTIKANYPDAYRIRAVALARKGRYEKSKEDASQYLELAGKQSGTSDDQGNRATMLSLRGYDAFKMKQYQTALKDYDQAISVDPKSASLYAGRAAVHNKCMQWDKAIEDADKAQEINPKDTSLYGLRGAAYLAQAKYQKALTDLDRAVEDTPTVELHRLRGSARLALHDWDGALQDFDYVLSIHPDDKTARAEFGKAKAGLSQAGR